MFPQEKGSLYDILEINSDSSPQEIRSAYLRLKAAYGKDSPALYSLMDKDDTDHALRQIEDAYRILSHPEKRRDYDLGNGFREEEFETPSRFGRGKIVSIDRVPPMDSSLEDLDILNPPSTDFTQKKNEPESISSAASPFDTPEKSFESEPSRDPEEYSSRRKKSRSETRAKSKPKAKTKAREKKSEENESNEDLSERISREKYWSGSFLKEIRETQRISIEEMADYTKISKTYLRAIESEDFDKLPAIVFLRGFIITVAKRLRLPSEDVSQAYLGRYRQHKQDRA